MHPTGALHGLVARPYEPLADSRIARLDQTRLLQSLQKTNPSPL